MNRPQFTCEDCLHALDTTVVHNAHGTFLIIFLLLKTAQLCLLEGKGSLLLGNVHIIVFDYNYVRRAIVSTIHVTGSRYHSLVVSGRKVL